MVVACVVEPLAQQITREVAVPTIGIGASAACDGQILVCDDVLGLFGDFKPRFVKQYADLAGTVEAAIQAFAADVRARRFPGPDQVYRASPAPGASEPL
jgi:3-methyl-2-oxobutanoate hydroxymethyltransferase